MNDEELKAFAAQLARPDGDFGVQVAESMNETNIGMTRHSVEQLDLKDDQQVLEIGHGNGAHVAMILSKANNLHYTGLEISSQMHAEARKLNEKIASGNRTFILYDGQTLPFESEQFDAVFTVNTLYFWKEPAVFLNDIYRVMKQKGVLAITFADKAFMKELPFTKYGFTLYSPEDMKALIARSSFSSYAHKESEETVKTRTGELVSRKFYTFILTK